MLSLVLPGSDLSEVRSAGQHSGGSEPKNAYAGPGSSYPSHWTRRGSTPRSSCRKRCLSLSGSATGALLITGSLTAAVLTPIWGSLIDRTGAGEDNPRAGLSIVGALVLSQTKTTWALVLAWAVVGAVVQCVSTGFQLLAATGVPGNRGGISFVLSHRFLGHAIGPLLWVLFSKEIFLWLTSGQPWSECYP